MNQEKIGLFIKRKRIEKGLTQDQLASRLYVSSKTISRWERGLNIPDISILESLSIELEVTVNELILGEENKIINDPNTILRYSQKERLLKIRKFKKYILILLIFFLILLLDSTYGYFSTSLNWQINDKTFFPHGILFSLIFIPDYLSNLKGIYLTKMFNIFIIVLSINIILIILYFYISYLENKIHINSK